MHCYRPETSVGCTFYIFGQLVAPEKSEIPFLISMLLIGKPDILFALEDIAEYMICYKSFAFDSIAGIGVQYYSGAFSGIFWFFGDIIFAFHCH
jgi:hypothetical protein